MSDEEIDALLKGLSKEVQIVVKILRDQNRQLQSKIEELQEQNKKLLSMVFGSRSEKMPSMSNLLRNEEIEEELSGTGDPSEDEDARNKKRRKNGRERSEPARKKKKEQRKKSLAVLETLIEVRNDQFPKGTSREDFRVMGQGSKIDRIDYIPGRHFITRYRLQTLVSKKDPSLILKASVPTGVAEGCLYGPGAHAHVVTAKCCDSLPLHRISKQLEREGVGMARSTLCSMFHRSAELLEPIYKALCHRVRNDPLVHADETRLAVQAKKKCAIGWIWVTQGSDAVTYTFAPTRSGSVAKELLGGTSGKLMADGYSGYNRVANDDRERCGCWAHCRRKFFEARSSAPEAEEVLSRIQDLYRIERDFAYKEQLHSKAHGMAREEKSRGVVETIRAWILEKRQKYPPKSPLGSAMGYFLNNELELSRFLEDTRVPLDNNAAERALRIIAVGRKNFLFAGNEQGAQNLAILQSVVSTCQMHAINPFEYIRDVLVRTQQLGVSLEQLLPWNWTDPRLEMTC